MESESYFIKFDLIMFNRIPAAQNLRPTCLPTGRQVEAESPQWSEATQERNEMRTCS
jgi:hypothetical protein